MQTIQDFCQFLEGFAPQRLAEDWDNVGLLVGDRGRTVDNVMTCLTITPESVREAIQESTDLIVSHHPLPFRPLKKITADSTVGNLLLQLVEGKCAVYSPHTRFDSCSQGINQKLAVGLGVVDPQPLQPIEGDPDCLGAGRVGRLAKPISVAELLTATQHLLGITGLHAVLSDHDQEVSKVAVACGSAGQLLADAIRQGCDAFVTGETNFHTSLEAKANGIVLVLPGHYASERFAVESLAETLQAEFPDCRVWASQQERDPLTWHP